MGQAEGGRSIAALQEGGEETSKEAMKGLPTFHQEERRGERRDVIRARGRELVEFLQISDCFFCDEEVCVFCFIAPIVVSVDVAD